MDSRRKRLLENHVARLRRCRRCPRVIPPPVSGGAIGSDVMVIGQAPGVREPTLKRPFAHTAGKTLFRWFKEFCGLDEATMRARIYFAAVIRCFPGKAPGGSDRIPATDEIRNCSGWMNVRIRNSTTASCHSRRPTRNHAIYRLRKTRCGHWSFISR